MTAVDTNVVVRLLTGDDPEQAAAARSVFSGDFVWIGRTVLLETAWVLGSAYGFEDSAVREAFTRLLGLANVQTEDIASVTVALKLNAQGLDLADALHLTGRPHGADFVSFDRTFVRRAKRAGAKAVSVLYEKVR
jgi:predicted nucleic-acid-binding protein